MRILGGVCLILALMLILAALDQGDTESTIVLAIGLVFLTAAIYCLAGAPQITKAIRRRFPNDGPPQRGAMNPRHKLKAVVGIGMGLAMGFPPLTMGLLGFLPEESAESWSEIIVALFFFAPAFSVWGAAHLAWHQGHSPLIPVVVAGFFFTVLWVLALIRNIELATACLMLSAIAPGLVVILLKKRSRHRSRG